MDSVGANTKEGNKTYLMTICFFYYSNKRYLEIVT